jgi:hypothetical protein
MFCAVAGAQVRACRRSGGMSLATEAPLSHTGRQHGVKKNGRIGCDPTPTFTFTTGKGLNLHHDTDMNIRCSILHHIAALTM